MPGPSFSTLSADAFIEHVVQRVRQKGGGVEAAYTMVLGSGFSHPLVPTGYGMVQQDIAWWTFAQKHNFDYTKGFAKGLPSESRSDFDAHSTALWQSAHEVTDEEGKPHFELDSKTKLPVMTGDSISGAYQAVMSGRCVPGL